MLTSSMTFEALARQARCSTQKLQEGVDHTALKPPRSVALIINNSNVFNREEDKRGKGWRGK
jgi:hypothetical protein